MPDDIAMSIDIQAPLERVWEAVATERGLRDWLNPTMTFDPRPGGRVEYPSQQLNEPYLYQGQVVALEPRRELAFEWAAGRSPRMARVTIALEPRDELVCVTLRQQGGDGTPADATSAADGAQQLWTGDELVSLKELVEGVGPTH